MNVHEWPYPSRDTCFIGHGYHDQVFVHSDSITDLSTVGRHQISKQKWLARRAELQSKPSWKDAPKRANWLGQCSSGKWEWYYDKEAPPVHADGDCWDHRSYGEGSGKSGEVLGDWRDTLEQRPAATPEPVVTKMMDEAIIDKFMGYVRAMPVSLSTVLSSEDLADLHQLCDAELTKRDAAVCGGQKYLDAHWFERGELPPIGEFVDVDGEDLVYGDGELNCEVIAHVENTAVIRMSYGLGCFQKHVLSPSRTERDKAIDEMKQHCPYHGSWDTVGRIYAEALYDAGYRKQNLPAN